VLVVGNDMRNDIRPALAAGCHAALFAGDRRSYRPRSGGSGRVACRPDARITALAQLERMVLSSPPA
jgi:FMN phosphatase YigB (HAD superfamily)